MSTTTYVRQVQHINKEEHEAYLKEFPEEPICFFNYVNVMLGGIYDDGNRVIDIKIIDLENVIIIYDLKIK